MNGGGVTNYSTNKRSCYELDMKVADNIVVICAGVELPTSPLVSTLVKIKAD